MYAPGGYRGVWARDFDFIVQNVPACVAADELRRIIRLFLRHQRADGAVPKHVSPQGEPSYLCWGRADQTEADSAQYAVKLVDDYCRRTGDLDLFAEVREPLRRAMDVMPRNPEGLVWIDPDHPHTPFGFTDQVFKTGAVLFSTLLYWEACRVLVERSGQIGDSDMTAVFGQRMERIEQNLAMLWDEASGAYMAASGTCRQVDVWGNAYLLYIGLPVAERRERISDYLEANLERYASGGQCRHVVEDSGWEKTRPNQGDAVPLGTYQNGAYWATPSGWVAYALGLRHPRKAARFVDDLVRFLRDEGVYECVNDAIGHRKIRDYVASVVNPLGAVRRMVSERE